MSYSIQTITDKSTWQTFFAQAKPSTFLHDWAWGETEKENNKKIFRLGVYKKQDDGQSTLCAIALLVVVKARRGNILLCPHGPVFAEANDVQANKEILNSITVECKKIGAQEKTDVIRICPIISDTPENKKIFKELGFRNAPIHVYSEYSWLLDITQSEEELLSGMKKNTRYGIRKAEKDGITVVSSTDIKDFDAFWHIYKSTAERQSFVPFPKKLIQAEFTQFLADQNVRLYFAEYKGEKISTAFIVSGPYSAFYHHGASLHMHSSITPGELLQWTIIKDAKARGLKKYDFWGVVPEGKTGHAWARLDRFKKSFGGYGQAYVHAQDYPLTWKYAFIYIIETIRKWKRNV